MKNNKSVLRSLIPWLIGLAAIAALVIFVGIPLYGTSEDGSNLPAPVIAYYEDGPQTLSMENDSLRFELDAQTTHFKLTEKKTGKEWLSNPANAAQDPIAVAANKATLQSTLIVTYSSASGTIDFNNYQYSIENGSYTVDQDDEGVHVHYAIGKIEKIYMLPTATTVERFTSFTDAMSKKDAKKVSGVYTRYKPDKVATMDNKDQLLSMYPELANQDMYVLKDNTSENNKKNIAQIFAGAGYTEEEYEFDKQYVAGTAESTDAVFNVTVTYKLDGDDFLIEVPFEKIRYRADYPITSLTVLPMFGAAGTQDNGFMLVPEGGGALIAFNNGKLSQNSYYANLYGWDYGSERREVVSETKALFPVFGMIKNDSSFLCIMEGAASYGGVQADISLRYNSYNWVCARYTILHSDRYNVSSKTARLVYMFEKQLPQDTIVQRYKFINSASYVDMANVYGQYLKDRYPELQNASAGEDMPVAVELVGAVDKKVVKFGLPVDSVVPATTFKQTGEIMDQLSGKGIKNLNLRMTGWANGGVTQKVLTRVNPIGALGGLNGMKDLIQKAKSSSVPLYFDGVTCFAYDSNIFNGFNAFRDAARFTTREQIIIYPYSQIYYQQDDAFDPYYLVEPGYAQRMGDNLINALKNNSAYGVAFRDIGNLLSGNYNPRETTTREQVRQMNVDTLVKARQAGQAVMIKEGNDYALPYADIVTDMDLSGILYSILDQRIPFYQIAFHGIKDYTGHAINLSQDGETELLRCAEYGAGLNFTFMAEDASLVQETLHTGFYGASYAQWSDHAADMILKYQQDMQGLNRQPITGHRVLAENVTETVYQNGVRVLVNYSSDDVTAEGISIPARSYLVVRGDD